MNQLLPSCKLWSMDIMGSLMFNHGLEVLKGMGASGDQTGSSSSRSRKLEDWVLALGLTVP